MHRAEFVKSDGRKLWLYGREPIELASGVPVPEGDRLAPRAHMRWHPLEGEWVIYASHRQGRPVTSSAGSVSNPLAPTTDPEKPTELPAGNWAVGVFENRFPSLTLEPSPLPRIPNTCVGPAKGVAEVVVFSQDPSTPLGSLGRDRIAMILAVMAERSRELAAQGARYVLPFENRGAEMGVTLHHPHAQIYAYHFLPARQSRTMAQLAAYRSANNRDLVFDLVCRELEEGIRAIDVRPRAASFVPPYARFPYEIWITPRRHVPDLSSLAPEEIDDLAVVLGCALRRLDALWSRPMPYLLSINQAPCDGEPHLEWTVRLEVWPIRRAPDKLKFLAGTELGAGVFASDVLPEEAAQALRAVTL